MNAVRTVAYEFGRRNRAQKAALVRQVCDDLGAESLLLIGVSPDQDRVNNVIERALLDVCPTVVASGLHDDDGTWPDYRPANVLDLPFADGEFDLVFSNAVIEHVGGEQRQRRMLAEIDRVASGGWVVTTPNRWFPVEAHRHTLFSHWRRSWAPHRRVTRLLGIRDLDAMLPDGRVTGLPVLSPTLTAVHIRAVEAATSAVPSNVDLVMGGWSGSDLGVDGEIAFGGDPGFAPGDVATNRGALLDVGGVIAVVEGEVAQRHDLGLDPVQPQGVGRGEHQLDIAGGTPVADLTTPMWREAVKDDTHPPVGLSGT